MALSGTPVNFGTPNDLSTASITGTLPSSTATDVGYCFIATSNGTSTPPTMSVVPTNWLLIGTATDAGSNAITVWLYYRVIAASEPTSLTWTLSSGSNTNAVMWCESGRNTTTPYKNAVVDVHALTSSAKTTATISATGGEIFSGFADRSGGGYSGGTDTLLTNGNPVHSAATSMYVQWSVTGVTGSIARTITGPATSVGAQFIYESVPSSAGVNAGTATGVGTVDIARPAGSPVNEFLLSRGNMYVAHRFCSNENAVTWGVELSAKACQSCVDMKFKAVEISTWMTTDGVWVASHDRDTARIFTTSVDIPTNPYSALTGLTTATAYPGTNYPIAKVTDLIDMIPSDTVIFIENKRNTDITAFLNMLSAYPNAANRFVVKASYAAGNGNLATSTPMAARLLGMWTWGYYYEADLPNLAATSPYFDLLGMDYSASAGAWTTILAVGKPVLGHVCLTHANQVTAFSLGANGVVTGKAFDGMPYAPAGLASGTGQAYDATTSATTPGTGNAGSGTGTGTAYDAAVSIGQGAGTAAGVGQVFDATVSVSTGATTAYVVGGPTTGPYPVGS